VIKSLVDTYFAHVHCQPYSYFQEDTFRRRLADQTLPKCLLLAVLASALRFSSHEYFHLSTREAIDVYARKAWLSVLNDHMTADNSPRLYVAQTTNMLAIIDFTGTEYRRTPFEVVVPFTDHITSSWSNKFRLAENWTCYSNRSRPAAHEGARL
jgi:hypothetical protein